MGTGLFFRLAAVGAFVAAPLSLNSTSATPAIFSGDANASGGPGLGIENTGGNVQGGKGHSESKTVMGDPSAAPTLAPVVTPKVVQNPGADALARARAQVAAAKAHAQQLIDDARARADAAAAAARQQADDARARSEQQSQDARARAEAANSSAYTND